MSQEVETPMAFEDEFEWLMSLALDGALDSQEAEKFEVLLRQEPENPERWARWQAVDNAFSGLPMAIPTADFSERFAVKLEIRERQRRLRTGAIFGLVAVTLWVSVLTGFFMLGAMIWTNQGVWLNSAIQDVTYWWSAIGQLGRALVNTGEALWSEPQTRALVVCYVASVMAILSGWFIFLQRSTRVLPLSDPQLVEA